MKRPFEAIKEIFLVDIIRGREDYKAVIEHAHSFMAWIVGFSIGGIYLIMSNLDKVRLTYSTTSIKTTLILLTISITTGVLYRIAIAQYQTRMRLGMLYTELAFSNREMMPGQPVDLSTVTDVREMGVLLKQYGEDVNALVERYIHSSEQDRITIWNNMKDHYIAVSEWARKDYQLASEHAKSTYQTAYGISKKKLDKLFNGYSSRPLRIWGWVCRVTFYTSCLSFIAVPILICILY